MSSGRTLRTVGHLLGGTVVAGFFCAAGYFAAHLTIPAALLCFFLGLAVLAWTDLPSRHPHPQRERPNKSLDFGAIAHTSDALIWSVDPEGHWTFLSERAARQIYGYETREMLGRPFTDFMAAEQARQDLDVFERIKRGEPVFHYETVHLRKDGRPVHLSLNAMLLRDEAGAVRGTTGTATDITARKRAEEALRASEATYRFLVENLEQAIFLKDRQGRYLAANRRCCAALGLSESAILGKTDQDLYPAELAAKCRLADNLVLNQGQRFEGEDHGLIGGHLRTTRVVKTPVRDGAGSITGILGVAWDVTEQRSLEQQLRQVQKMEAIGQLAGGVAHDFNNLLTAILGNASLIASSMLEGDPNRQLTDAIESAALRAATLTGQLLGFARRTLLRLQPLRLDGIVEEEAALLLRTIDPRITVQVRTPPDSWHVHADPSQMNQLVMNLCLNARDAMPEGGQLLVQLANVELAASDVRGRLEARAGEFVRLRICDTGHGMPPEVRERIYEPFFTTKEQGRGTGLGLAVVFGIVKQHRGWIECTSRVGQGTRFDVYLPRYLVEAAVVADSPTPREPIRHGNETILLVDDEAILRTLAKAILEQHGYRVLLAEDGEDAVDLYRRLQSEIDLVILDLMMPRLSGNDAFNRLVQLDPRVRVLFASGYASEQISDADHPCCLGFIAKPYRPNQLAVAVRKALDRAARNGNAAPSAAR